MPPATCASSGHTCKSQPDLLARPDDFALSVKYYWSAPNPIAMTATPNEQQGFSLKAKRSFGNTFLQSQANWHIVPQRHKKGPAGNRALDTARVTRVYANYLLASLTRSSKMALKLLSLPVMRPSGWNCTPMIMAPPSA